MGKVTEISFGGHVDAEVISLFEEILSRGADLKVRVTGVSMAPFLRGGEILTLRRVPGDSLKRGDLVLCRKGDGAALLHRIISKWRSGGGRATFVTKGDGLGSTDGPVGEEEILGKACFLERPSPSGKKTHDLNSPIWRGRNYIRALVSGVRSGPLKYLFR
jgi:signal peptidase I